MADGRGTIYEDMTFSVSDRGDLGIEVSFVGLDDGEETSGSKWFTDAAGAQVVEAIEKLGPSRTGPWLAKRTGIDSQWEAVDRAGTQWRRDYGDGVLFATREKTSGGDEFWLRTEDHDGSERGPRSTPEVFDAAGAREEASRIAAEARAVAPRT